jgi:uncharacterized membrane protein YdbT with pleckstrin-like domain
MSYAQSVLQPGETIIGSGRLHWIIYGWAIVTFVSGVVVVWLLYRNMPQREMLITIAATTFGVLFLATVGYAWFIRWITEFAVTNRRIIFKRGFIWRQTEEMNMDKVETVDVHQTVLGRLLDYGTIRVMGTGGSNAIAVERIAAPFKLRNAIIAK